MPLLLACVVLFGYPEESQAAPSNGVRLPPKGRAQAGYEFNVMFKRPLGRSYGNLKTRDHFYTVSLGLLDWLSLDGKIGLGDVMRKGGTRLAKLEFNTGFAGGYGFRIRAFEYEPWKVTFVLGAQHICVHPEVRSVNNDKFTSILDDWQVCGLAAKDFEFLTAYAGIKGSECYFIYQINKHDRKRRSSKNHIGLVGGLDFYLFEDKLRVGVEARFFDETAFSTAVAYLF